MFRCLGVEVFGCLGIEVLRRLGVTECFGVEVKGS